MSHVLLKKHFKMNQYWYIAFVYFNCMKPLFQFRAKNNTPLTDLKTKLENLLHYTNNLRVVKIEYCSPAVDDEWKTKFNKFDADVRVM